MSGRSAGRREATPRGPPPLHSLFRSVTLLLAAEGECTAVNGIGAAAATAQRSAGQRSAKGLVICDGGVRCVRSSPFVSSLNLRRLSVGAFELRKQRTSPAPFTFAQDMRGALTVVRQLSDSLEHMRATAYVRLLRLKARRLRSRL